MSLEQIVITSQAKMSLNERFTQLRRAEARGGGGVGGLNQAVFRQGSSIRNRRLAMQMAKRPAVVAALARSEDNPRWANRMNGAPIEARIIGRMYSQNMAQRGNRNIRRRGSLTKSLSLQSLNVKVNQAKLVARPNKLRQRLGVANNVRKLARSQSLQSLNAIGTSFRGNKRGRPFPGRGTTNFRKNNQRGRQGFVKNTNQNMNVQQSLRGRRNSFRGRGGARRGVTRGGNTGGRGGNMGGRGGNMGGRGGNMGGRGGNMGGRGANGGNRGGTRGGNNRGRQNNPAPSREVLDNELDQYMSACRSTLDKELDLYMNQSEETWD